MVLARLFDGDWRSLGVKEHQWINKFCLFDKLVNYRVGQKLFFLMGIFTQMFTMQYGL